MHQTARSRRNLFGMVGNTWKYRELIAQLAWRDVIQRYRGSIFGLVWAFLIPMAMLTIYTLVFGVVLQARWQEKAGVIVEASGAQGFTQFAVIIYSGLILYEIFSISISRSASAIFTNPNYVKKVVFPLHILPLSIFLATLIHGAINLLILVALSLCVFPEIHWQMLFLPVLLLALSLLTLGLSLMVAALGVFIRDLNIGVGLILQVLFFMSPIFYSVNLVPQRLHWFIWIMRLNPLTTIIEEARNMIIWGRMPDWPRVGGVTLAGLVIFAAGYAFFSRCKRYFADAI